MPRPLLSSDGMRAFGNKVAAHLLIHWLMNKATRQAGMPLLVPLSVRWMVKTAQL